MIVRKKVSSILVRLLPYYTESLAVMILLLFTIVKAQAKTHTTIFSDIDDVAQHLPMASALVLKTLDIGSNDTWGTTIATYGAIYLTVASTTWILKQTTYELRPDGSDRHSLPSGHAMFAFAGATTLRYEYGKKKPWVAVAGYGVATLVAIDRVRLHRHYTHDVLCGATIGILSGELCYYVKRHLLKSKKLEVTFSGQTISLNYNFD